MQVKRRLKAKPLGPLRSFHLFITPVTGENSAFSLPISEVFSGYPTPGRSREMLWLRDQELCNVFSLYSINSSTPPPVESASRQRMQFQSQAEEREGEKMRERKQAKREKNLEF